MSKVIRKLNAEIEKNLKALDEVSKIMCLSIQICQ
jgi:hypothetical protein